MVDMRLLLMAVEFGWVGGGGGGAQDEVELGL